MATQWMDDFTSYGTDSSRGSRLLNGVYAEAAWSGLDVDPDPNAGGNMVLHLTPNTAQTFRKVLSSAQTTVGIASRVWFSALPNDNASWISGVSDINNVIHVYVVMNASGYLVAYRNDSGGQTQIGISTAPVVTANAWTHYEIKYVINATTGSLEVRKEGVQVPGLVLSGINTVSTVAGAVASVSNIRLMNARSISTPDAYFKDLIIWDGTGTVNNNFFGSCQVYKLVPNADVSLNWNPVFNGPTSVNAPTTNTSGGTLAAGTYYYKITALSGAGESLASPEVSITTTGTTSTVSLSWNPVTNATGYKIYRGTTAGGENVFYAPVGTTTSFVDTGAANSGGTPPVTTPNGYNKINETNPDDDTGYIAASIVAVPTNGALTQTAGGALAATTYYVRCTWVNAFGETAASLETSLATSANNVLNVAAPSGPPAGTTGWNVYVSTSTNTETKQNGGTPLALAAAWVEPTTGLVAGSAYPTSNTTMPPAAKFSLTQLPPNTSSVRSVMTIHRSRKIDGGDGNLQVGLISGGATGLGSNRPITSAYTYWWDVYDQDPNGTINWTKTSVNLLNYQLNRTL